ncbi:MAG: type II secretion system protein [Dehalococcoidales bacterium]|nr:type II secretion system protein [Dehalococcoidales bacterium]
MMKIRGMLTRRSGQSGFTLVEVLVGIALTGILSVALTAGIAQIINVNASSTSQMSVIKDVENAVDAIRADILMAQRIEPGSDDIWLTLEWTSWENARTTIEYRLLGSGELQREETVNFGETIVSEATRIVGQNIADIDLVDPGNRKTWNVTIVSAVDGYKPASETRTFEILPRPGN